MHLVEIFLPIFNNSGARFPMEAYDRVRHELTDRFGGITAFLRSPAVGLWQDASGVLRRDEIAVFEVMAERLEHDWWHQYRQHLERRFQQQEVVVRATLFERL